ncbi:MAG TPA: T9SS type A sorting domain-containing protein [Bacteroidia bacterium]|nr:T9SS type A sorting domain-containing protein [Bacteroidia bacterium]
MILEIATGTWCTYCPGAAMGADELHASSASVGVVKHHDSDPYETPESVARYGASYYNVTGFPTAFFDGANSVVGGSHSNSMYNSYLPKYTTAMGVATPLDLTATWVQNGASIDVTAVVNQIGAYSAGNLRLQACVTESHIQVNWQGMTEVNFVNRDMYPDANGQAVTVTQGNSQTFNFNIPISPSWTQNEMELVVWVENGSTKQIFNGRYMPLAVAAFANDPMAVEIENAIGTESCIDAIAPEVKIRNMGSAALTSVDFSYNVNGGTPMTYTWTGNLPFLSYATATLPSISFAPAGSNTLTVNITNANDGNMANNTTTATWNAATYHGAGTYVMTIQPDNYGSETTWDIKNGAGSVVASGGPYTDNNTTPINVNVTINPNDCYSVNVYDSYGDGMCCGFGQGSYTLTSPNSTVVATGGQFGSSEMKSWTTEQGTAVNPELTASINVYPNPSRGVFNIEIPNVNNAEITIVTVTGKLVYTTNTNQSLSKIDLSNLAAGMYLVRVKTEEGLAVKKITKE